MLRGERGQGTVEYVGLILLVSLLMVGMVAAMKGFNGKQGTELADVIVDKTFTITLIVLLALLARFLLHRAIAQVRIFVTGAESGALDREDEVVAAMRTAVGLERPCQD